MPSSSFKVERVALIFLLGIALLTALVPLVVIHDPNGARASNVFDLPAGINQLQAELRIVAPIKSAAYSGPAATAGVAPPATPGPLPIPFSIRMAPIVPWCIFAALFFSLIALLDLLFFNKAVAMLSLIGGFLVAVALLHVLVLGSDLQAWTDALSSITELSAPDDLNLGARILTINSFLITPGVGLYVLTMCLLVVPLLYVTRGVARLSDYLQRAARVRASRPVQIRPLNSECPAETCMSLDLSQSGLYLESTSNHYYVGMELYLTRHQREGTPVNPEEHGYVVRVEKKDKGGCRFAVHVIANDNE
jgi:hypothetical protein